MGNRNMACAGEVERFIMERDGREGGVDVAAVDDALERKL